MKIAVSSQNRKTVTGHAGRCRRFWIYEVAGGEVQGRTLLELPQERSLHEGHDAPHPLDTVNVLIAGGMGWGLQQRLKQKGILAVVTPETDPDRAVAAWIEGTLPEIAPGDPGHGHRHYPHHTHL